MLGLPATAMEVEGGAQVPDNAQKVAERRYRTRNDLEETLKFYKKEYPPNAYPRKSIVNQPGIKALHIVNPSGKGFEGLNIYVANEEVRIYVVPVGDGKVKEKKKEKEKPKAK